MSLKALTESAIDDLNEWLKENPSAPYPGDEIHEVADAACPVYTYDILKLASDNWELITTEPEIGPAFDGKPTPLNIIAANIYEHLTAALYSRLYEWREEQEEAA